MWSDCRNEHSTISEPTEGPALAAKTAAGADGTGGGDPDQHADAVGFVAGDEEHHAVSPQGEGADMNSKIGFFETPPLRWTGGKWKLADWLIGHFPPHELYCEPFCGGAAVFFRKWPSRIEVLNDLDGDVVNFFTVLRERPDDLVRAVDLTPYSRAEYLQAYEPCSDPLERARRFYVLSRQSFGAYAGRKTGWRTQRNWNRGTNITGEWARLDGLFMAAERLKDAIIECDEATTVIERYDGERTLFYVDPPYVLRSRSGGVGRHRYTHEMSDEEHRGLAAVLHHVKGMVLLSGYESDLYRELYPDWLQLKKTTTTNGNSSAEECLWLSPRATAMNVLPLFAEGWT